MRLEVKFRPDTDGNTRHSAVSAVLDAVKKRHGTVQGLSVPLSGPASLNVEWSIPSLAAVALAQAEGALRQVCPDAYVRVPALPEGMQRIG